MAKLSEYELEKFDDIYSDAKWLEGKTARKHNGRTEVEPTPGPGHVYEMLEGLPEPGVNQNPPARNPDLERLMASTLGNYIYFHLHNDRFFFFYYKEEGVLIRKIFFISKPILVED